MNETEFKEILARSEAGDTRAMCQLAMAYEQGDGVKKDIDASFCWLEKAANLDLPSAQFVLASYYVNGFGTSKDERKAIYWLTQSSNKGYAPSKTRLGIAYITGFGVPVDEEKGIALLQEAVSLGDDEAKEFLQNMSNKEQEDLNDRIEIAKKENHNMMIGIIIGAIIGAIIGVIAGILEGFELESIGGIIVGIGVCAIFGIGFSSIWISIKGAFFWLKTFADDIFGVKFGEKLYYPFRIIYYPFCAILALYAIYVSPIVGIIRYFKRRRLLREVE